MPRTSSSGKTVGQSGIPLAPLRDCVLFPGVIHTLHVARETAKRAFRKANDLDGRIVCVLQRDRKIEEPAILELFEVGTVCELLQTSPLPDGSMRAVLRAVERVRLIGATVKSGVRFASVATFIDQSMDEARESALAREAVKRFIVVAENNPAIPPECLATVEGTDGPASVADVVAYHMPMSLPAKQAVLERENVQERLELLLDQIAREANLLTIQKEVAGQVERALGESQRDYYLREQLRAIQNELGDSPDREEYAEWLRRIDLAEMPEDAKSKAVEVLERLGNLGPGTPESAMAREYLEWLVSMPWGRRSAYRPQIEEAIAILDARHSGMESVKTRIAEYLAVRQLAKDLRGPILCFVGPPGVGKSSVVESIARAMGRRFARISLGGVRDEAEIRGHRRTYVGAMPGRIVKELRQCGESDPVVLLDEIDKMGRDWRGDPTGALLEALDPIMNDRFVDHFLETPVNLRDVVFVATANSMENVLPALRDRLEVVEFSSYSEAERRRILTEHLWPTELQIHGLDSANVQLEEEAIDALVNEYSCEPGVRQLAQRAATICRKVALQFATEGSVAARIGILEVEEWLGPVGRELIASPAAAVGRCHGLAVSNMGGMTMPIEAVFLEPAGSETELVITGNAGEVMRESVQAASTFIRRNRVRLRLEGPLLRDLHLHVGEGALPKDGPSAGLAIVLAMVSALSGRPLDPAIATSGEIGILGDVRPVGGIREKTIAARRDGVARLILPARNEADWKALTEELKTGIELVLVSTIDEAIEAAFRPIGSGDRRSTMKRG